MPGLGVPELLIILVVLLVIFGPKRLPQLGRQLGSGMREFKDSVTGKAGDDDDDERPAITASESTPTSSPQSTPVSTPASTPQDAAGETPRA